MQIYTYNYRTPYNSEVFDSHSLAKNMLLETLSAASFLRVSPVNWPIVKVVRFRRTCGQTLIVCTPES